MKIKSISVAMFLVLFLGALAYTQNKVPYSIRGDISNTLSSATQKTFFEGVFTNKASKQVESFTIVFFVFDQDGNSPLRGRNNVVIKIEETVPVGSSFSFSRGLDDFFYAPDDSEFLEDEVEYECEYLYVSRILYSDDTEWSDPFGFEYF